eukprot:17409-Heterococcus_DN1.PRE.1
MNGYFICPVSNVIVCIATHRHRTISKAELDPFIDIPFQTGTFDNFSKRKEASYCWFATLSYSLVSRARS